MSIQNEKTKVLENKIKNKYLTEELLGEFLEVLYPNKEWIHDERFQADEHTYNFKPDYCCHELKMCVEFDGPDHYVKANIVQADENKDQKLHELGYKIVRIPYFIQLDRSSIQFFFDKNFSFSNRFPHGFVSKNVVLPASFCEQGIWKFKKLLLTLDTYERTRYIFNEIRESLVTKINDLSKKVSRDRAGFNVVPSSLVNYLEFIKYSKDTLNNHDVAEKASNLNKVYAILESSQIIRELPGLTNLNYIYTSEGNIKGYFFNILETAGIISYNVIISNDTLTINIFKDNKLLRNFEGILTNINVQNIVQNVRYILELI